MSGGVWVTLDRALISLWTAPASALAIPRLTGLPITRSYAGVAVQFVGDDYPTGFRGQAKSRSYALTARYMADERDQVAALLDLFDAAHSAADSRLLLRTHIGQVPGLDAAEAVQVFGVTPTPQMGQYWDVAFTATVVQSTIEV